MFWSTLVIVIAGCYGPYKWARLQVIMGEGNYNLVVKDPSNFIREEILKFNDKNEYMPKYFIPPFMRQAVHVQAMKTKNNNRLVPTSNRY